MTFINCKEIAQKWKNEVKAEGVNAVLRVIQVGNDPASDAYIKGKRKDCEEVGFKCQHIQIESGSADEIIRDVKEALWQARSDFRVDGAILQLPMPRGISLGFNPGDHLTPGVDVDGFGTCSAHHPCTPEAVMELLKEIGVSVNGKHCVIAGYSMIVGKPLAHMMSEAGATVTICRSRTPEKLLYKLASEADIFVSAVGQPKFISSDIFKDGAVVIDVGINRTKDGICGDIEVVENTNDIMITPVPGGVGLLTRAMLMRHVLAANKMNPRKRTYPGRRSSVIGVI